MYLDELQNDRNSHTAKRNTFKTCQEVSRYVCKFKH